MSQHLSHDIPDAVPSWYKPQPHSPYSVYDRDTIKDIQRTLSCNESGELDETTVNHLKGLQSMLGIPITGVIDLPTAQAIQRLRDRYGSNNDLQR